jgi:hypothetical protein
VGDDKPAYVHYEKFSISEGITLLRNCGAVPVWAHPYLFRGGEVEDVLKELVDAGLMGIEVYHPSHTPKETKKLEALCSQYGLLMTGGSDYHGPSPDGKSSSSSTLNMMHLPLALLDPSKRRLKLTLILFTRNSVSCYFCNCFRASIACWNLGSISIAFS